MSDYIARFWSKVNKDGPVPPHVPGIGKCWEWKASVRTNGYGQFYSPKHVAAHRYSWAINNGAVPEGLFVLHRCDNRICVNPAHLFLGDSFANVRDCVKKKRHSCSRKTACVRGHAFTPDNTYIDPDGYRHCRECINIFGRMTRSQIVQAIPQKQTEGARV